VADTRALVATLRATPLAGRDRNEILNAAQVRRRRFTQRWLLRWLRLLLFLLVDARTVTQLLVRGLRLRPARSFVTQFFQRIQKELELRARHAFVLSPARQDLRQSLLKLTVARN
jgi:hypothetical protein